VVGEVGDDAACAAGREACDPPREVVRLAAGVQEEHAVESGGGHGREKSFGELDRCLVEVSAVGVEPPELGCHSCRDGRVGVPEHRYVVVGVEVGATVGAVQLDPASGDEVDRALIAQR
jgi:hypothetical protein